MDYALQLLGLILLGLYAGHWLDNKTGREPLFTLLGMLLGMVLGIGILYKRSLSAPKKEKPGQNEQQNKDQAP